MQSKEIMSLLKKDGIQVEEIDNYHKYPIAEFSMQFLADVMKKMSDKNLITIHDLYEFSEKEIIEKIENCEEKNIAQCFKIWKNATQIKEGDIPPGGCLFY